MAYIPEKIYFKRERSPIPALIAFAVIFITTAVVWFVVGVNAAEWAKALAPPG